MITVLYFFLLCFIVSSSEFNFFSVSSLFLLSPRQSGECFFMFCVSWNWKFYVLLELYITLKHILWMWAGHCPDNKALKWFLENFDSKQLWWKINFKLNFVSLLNIPDYKPNHLSIKSSSKKKIVSPLEPNEKKISRIFKSLCIPFI